MNTLHQWKIIGRIYKMGRSYSKDSFYGWLRHERFSVGLTLFCALFPVFITKGLYNIFKAEDDPQTTLEWIYKIIYMHPFQVANILFIFFALILLAKINLLIDNDEEKAGKLFYYVKDVFGENSTLAQYEPNDLFDRLRIGIQQFYFSWIAVWTIWLALYIMKFVLCIYQEHLRQSVQMTVIGYGNEQIVRLGNLLENSLNLLNSCIILFIYFVITIATVRAKALANTNLRSMCIGFCFIVLLGIFYFAVDIFSLFSLNATDYNALQFKIRFLIGIVATISLIALLGRFNTNYLNIPQGLMMCMYLYAAVQMFYPYMYSQNAIIENTINVSPNMINISKSTVNVSQNTINILRDETNTLRDTIKVSPKETNDLRKAHNEMSGLLFTIAFMGKIGLFFVLRWIAQRKRFLFFLLHKGHTLSDANAMLRKFNKDYEGCPDK